MIHLEPLLQKEGFYKFVIRLEVTDQLKKEDLQFIESIRNILIIKYSDPDFGVLELSTELSISYLKLFRKLKKITSKSAKTIIQEYRMLSATELIKNNNIPLGEIAERVGFKSQSNFNVYFKKHFECTPTSFQKHLKTPFKKTFLHPENLKLIITKNNYLNYSIKNKIFFDCLFHEIWKNLSNENYSAKYVSKNLFISYSQLNRKLIKLSSYSIGQLLQSIRLEHAAWLLKNSKTRVNEIVYITGFKENSYFSKAFKKRFELTPSKYRSNKSTMK